MITRLRPRAALWLLPLLLVCAPRADAVGQTVYRCGGNVYSEAPCAQGRPIDVDDSRSDAQRAEARDVAVREAALAARMEADRRQADAAARPRQGTDRPKARPVITAALATPRAPDKRNRRSHGRRQDTEDGDFVAFGPAPPRAAKSGR